MWASLRAAFKEAKKNLTFLNHEALFYKLKSFHLGGFLLRVTQHVIPTTMMSVATAEMMMTVAMNFMPENVSSSTEH